MLGQNLLLMRVKAEKAEKSANAKLQEAADLPVRIVEKMADS